MRLHPPVIARGILWSPWPLTNAVSYRAIDLSISTSLSSRSSSSACAALCPGALILDILAEFRASPTSQNYLLSRVFGTLHTFKQTSGRDVPQRQILVCREAANWTVEASETNYVSDASSGSHTTTIHSIHTLLADRWILPPSSWLLCGTFKSDAWGTLAGLNTSKYVSITVK